MPVVVGESQSLFTAIGKLVGHFSMMNKMLMELTWLQPDFFFDS